MNVNQTSIFSSYTRYTETVSYKSSSSVTKDDGGLTIGKQENNKSFQLSDSAREYLESLRQKYTNIDFTVADFTTQEEADEIMRRSGGTKDYSAVIDPDTLEKMAADEEIRAKYESILAGAGDKFEEVRSQFEEEDLKDIKSLGLSIDKDGNVNYIVRMRQGNIDLMESNRKSMETRREELKERWDKEERTHGPGRKPERRPERRPGRMEEDEVTLTASSVEELVEKIKIQLAENKREFLQTEEEKTVGQTIDFQV